VAKKSCGRPIIILAFNDGLSWSFIHPILISIFGWLYNTFFNFFATHLLLFLVLLPFIVVVVVVFFFFFTVIGRPYGFSNGNFAMQDRNVDRDTEAAAEEEEGGAISLFGNTMQVGG
jgi:hypothetical protein